MKRNELSNKSSDWIMDEIWSQTRRLKNHTLREPERIQYAAYLCELWEALYIRQCETIKATMGQTNVAA